MRVRSGRRASYVEDQDQWWLPGIFRSVSLRHRPVDLIDDVHVHADYDPETGTGLLRVDTDQVSARWTMPELGIAGTTGEEVAIAGISPWSAETPRLYELVVESPGERARRCTSDSAE